MSEISDIVDVLENRVSKLLHKLELLKQTNSSLTQRIEALENAKTALEKEVADGEEKYQALKMANSMLGSNDNNKEAKLKINTLIRELDHCITQLAE
jgi:phage shock protein A